MKKQFTILSILIFVLGLVPINISNAQDLADRLTGKILLQVEDKGQGWYIDPDTQQRAYLGRPADAFKIMRELGLGIKHNELEKYLNSKFPKRLSGKILLDVENNGEAYYIYPEDLKGYYLSRPDDAFRIMREKGLGITNKDLDKVPVFQKYKEQVEENANAINKLTQKIEERERKIAKLETEQLENQQKKTQQEQEEKVEEQKKQEEQKYQKQQEEIQKDAEAEWQQFIFELKNQQANENNNLFNTPEKEIDKIKEEVDKTKEIELQTKVSAIEKELENMEAELKLAEKEYNTQRDYLYFLESQPAKTETTTTHKENKVSGITTETKITTTQKPNLEEIQTEKRKMLMMAQDLGSKRTAIDEKTEELQAAKKLLCIEQGNVWCW